MNDETQVAVGEPTSEELAALEVLLGLGAQGKELRIPQGGLPLDANPWLGDVYAAHIKSLGHQDLFPRPHDWENLLAMMEPGEELTLLVDYRTLDEVQRAPCFSVHLVLRAPRVPIWTGDVPGERRRRFEALLAQFRRQAFPESETRPLSAKSCQELIASPPGDRVLCVAGKPSPRTLEAEQRDVVRNPDERVWQSLNDVVETCMDLGEDFRIAFSVTRLSDAEVRDEFRRASATRDCLHRFVRETWTDSENESEQRSEATGTADQSGGSQKAPDFLGGSLVRSFGNLLREAGTAGSAAGGAVGGALAGAAIGGPIGAGIGAVVGAAVGGGAGEGASGKPAWKDARATRTWSTTKTTTQTHGWSRTEGLSRSAERIRTDLEVAEKSLERYANALYEARGTGGYRTAAFVFGSGADAEIIGQAVRGVLAGSRSQDWPISVFPIEIGEVAKGGAVLSSTLPAVSLVEDAAPVLALHQARNVLLLPEAELPGLRLRKCVFLGRNSAPPPPEPEHSEDSWNLPIVLGPDAFTVLTRTSGPAELRVAARDLFRHVLIAGTTGSGKTRRAIEIVNRIDRPDLRIVVFETAKRTWRHWLARGGKLPRVLRAGNPHRTVSERLRPLRLNPFYFDPGTSLRRHVALLADALAELMPTEALIGPKMREAVEDCYIRLGWDIERSQWSDPIGDDDGLPIYPNVIDFVDAVDRISASLNYGPEVNANYRGALEGRARVFLDASYQDLFSHDGNVPIEELFPAGEDVIVEFEELPAGELDVRAFVMSILLARIRAARADAHAGGAQNSRWLLVVEEAHNVLDRDTEIRRDARESNAGRTLLRSFVGLLQEGRELGIGVVVVDQSPSRLARSVITNTNTKIVMRIEDGAELEEMGQTLGLEEDAWKDLGYLQRGEGVVKASHMARPVKSSAWPDHQLGDRVEFSEDADGEKPAPSYQELGRLWRRCLEGIEEPDSNWEHALEAASVGNLELAAFPLLQLLQERRDGDRATLLALRRAKEGDWPALLEVGRTLFLRARGRQSAAMLLLLERRIFAALVGLAAPPAGQSVAPAAVRMAAAALTEWEQEGADWEHALGLLAYSEGAGWEKAAERLRGLMAQASQDAPLYGAALLRVLSARLADHPSYALARDRWTSGLELRAAIRELVLPVTLDQTEDRATAEDLAAVAGALDRLVRATGRTLVLDTLGSESPLLRWFE